MFENANGEFVNDGAREIGVSISCLKTNTESNWMLPSLLTFFIICRKKLKHETNTSSLSQDISIEDSLAHVLGSKEHCGRVRGMGLGPCPSRVFGYTRNFHFGTSSSCPSYSELQNQVIDLDCHV